MLRSKTEYDCQKRLQEWCGFRHWYFNNQHFREIVKYLADEDFENLKYQICRMYHYMPQASEWQQQLIRIAEWLVDTYLNLKDKYSDREQMLHNFVFMLNKQMSRIEDLCFMKEADILADVILRFTKEIGSIRNKEREKKHNNNEYLTDEEIEVEIAKLNVF